MVSSRVVAMGSFAAAVVTLVASLTLVVLESFGSVGDAAKRQDGSFSLTALPRAEAAVGMDDAEEEDTGEPVPHIPPFTGDLTVVWTSGELVEGLASGLAAEPLVNGSTVVHGDPAHLTGSRSADGEVVDDVPPGWYVPIDAFAVDPAMYAAVVPGAQAIDEALDEPDGAVLSASSAEIRGLGVGAVIRLDDQRLDVRLVVPDAVVGGAEVVVSNRTGRRLGITTERSVLLRHEIERADLEAVVAAHVPAGLPRRVRSTGETAFLRYADNVMPQIQVKLLFGEFALRPTAGREVEIDPSWIAENVVDVQLPVVGATRCHRRVVDALTAALTQVAQQEAILAEPAVTEAEAAIAAATAVRSEAEAARAAAAATYHASVAAGASAQAAQAVVGYEQADAALTAAHTAVLEAEAALEEAMQPRLVDPAQFAGCQVSRLISEGAAPSRHAWGIAVDLNTATNPLGGASTQHQLLVDIMRSAGFGWGGDWLAPDPMHFEYLTEPAG